MTKYFYDTEFLEDGKTIELISIGIVCEDGRELYLQNLDCCQHYNKADDWVKQNVLSKLTEFDIDTMKFTTAEYNLHTWKTEQEIAQQVQEFLVGDNIELWGNYCSYDHVALCQLWGKAVDKPNNIPWISKDIQQLVNDNSIFNAILQEDEPHNALNDAKHIKKCYYYLKDERDYK